MNVADRNKIVEENLDIAKFAAAKMRRRIGGRVEFGDLLSAATLGLIDAADRFDPGRGVKFTSFATTRVAGAIVDHLRTNTWNNRGQQKWKRRFLSAESAFFAEHGRKPTDDELRLQLGLDEVEYQRRRIMGIGGDHVQTARERDRAVPAADDAERSDWWTAAVRGLDRRDKMIVMMYYRDGLTLNEIGKTLGVCEARVSQLHGSIVQRLRLSHSFRRMVAQESAHAA